MENRSSSKFQPTNSLKIQFEKPTAKARVGAVKSIETNQIHRGDLHRGIHNEEVIASHVMKELTNKYGTRGKSAKNIFLSAFEEELRGGVKAGKFLLVCDEEEESNSYNSGNGVKTPTKLELVTKALKINHALGQIMERPAAMVTQSAFMKRLDEQTKQEINRLGCGPPTYEMFWLFEEGKFESQNGSTLSIRDALQEAEEKLLARLKVYKRAFSAIILHFEALRPILRDVKRTYDFVINMKDHQLREAKIVTRNIHHAEKALDDQMERVRFEGYLRIAELEKQCMLLMTHVEKQDAAITTMTTILIRLETSLSEEHDIRRESEDSRKLLIVEINELRRKMGMGPRLASGIPQIEEQEENQGEPDVITNEDPLILRSALEMCRKNLTDAQNRLTVLEADYADVIPRHEFESLKKAMNEVLESQAKTNATYEVLSSQVQGLKDQIEKLISERGTLQELVNDLRTKATPRPSWNKISEHLDGGLPYWQNIYMGKSSNQIVDKLVEEFTGKKVASTPEYKAGLGNISTVPRHLRFDGRIRVRYLTRRDMAVIINDIWQTRCDQLDLARRQHDSQNEEESGSYSFSSGGGGLSSLLEGPTETILIRKFPDFFADYFEERYHLLNLRMEWTYNIVDACKRLAIDERLVQFLGILDGNINEVVYHLFKAETAKAISALTKKASEIAKVPGFPTIPLADFNKTLEEIFPDKTEDQLQRLSRAAAKQSNAFADWSPVKYASFFIGTDEGLIGEFIEEMAKQLDEDRIRYVYEVLNELLAELGVSLASAERQDDPAGDTDVSMMQIYTALITVDPTMPDEKMGASLAWIFMGETSLPGTPPKGVHLVEYIKSHIRRSGYDSDDEDEHDDEDFERAIRDIQDHDSTEDEDISAKRRKAKVKKLKVTSLRLVVKRFKGGAFLRHGLRYPKVEDSPPVPAVGDGSTEPSGENDPNAVVNADDGLKDKEAPNTIPAIGTGEPKKTGSSGALPSAVVPAGAAA